jgi:hypothetical protein
VRVRGADQSARPSGALWPARGTADYLLRQLKVTREAPVCKLDGLSEYDIRRLLTVTGTNFLGLRKHMAASTDPTFTFKS